MARVKEELGRALFFARILSRARVRSCATCHNPGLAWGDGEPRAIGENQVRLPLLSTSRSISWLTTPLATDSSTGKTRAAP